VCDYSLQIEMLNLTANEASNITGVSSCMEYITKTALSRKRYQSLDAPFGHDNMQKL
jgi:hypothetical protein